MFMDTFMLTLKAPSFHGNNSECGAKEVNIKVSTDFTYRFYKMGYLNFLFMILDRFHY